MNGKIIVIILIVVSAAVGIFLLNNSKSSANYASISIKPKLSFDRYSDSNFVNNRVKSIAESKGRYYICEEGSKGIVVLDENFKYLNRIGKEGSGPGEFLAPWTCEVNKDSLYVLDAEKNSIMIFELKGKYARAVMLPERVSDHHHFIINDNNNMMISLCNNKMPIHEISNGKIINSFGEYSNIDDKRSTILNGQSHIGLIQNKRVVVHESEPFIDLYDQMNKFEKRIDLSVIKQVKDRILAVNEMRAKQKGSLIVASLFKDISIYENKIYILFNTIKQDKQVVSIIVVEYKNDNLSIKELYELMDENGKNITNGRAICKTKDKLVVAENAMKVNQIYVYEK